MEAVVLRHAQSVWNASGRWQGQADPPLSMAGEAQVRAVLPVLGQLAPFDLIVSSDLARARVTADLMADGLGRPGTRLVEPLLREYDVGEWSGLDRATIEARWPEQLGSFDAGRLEAPPGGESRSDFDERVKDGLRRTTDVACTQGSRRLLVVAHGGVIRSMMRAAGIAERHIRHLCGIRADLVGGVATGVRPVDLPAVADPAPTKPYV